MTIAAEVDTGITEVTQVVDMKEGAVQGRDGRIPGPAGAETTKGGPTVDKEIGAMPEEVSCTNFSIR